MKLESSLVGRTDIIQKILTIVEGQNLSLLLVRVKWCSYFESTVAVFQSSQMGLRQSSNFTLGFQLHSTEMKACTHKNMYTNSYSCIILNSQEVETLTCLATVEYINGNAVCNTMEYISVTKRNRMLVCAVPQTNLGSLVLNERN